MTKKEQLERTIKEMENTLEILRAELVAEIAAEEAQKAEAPKAPKVKKLNKCITVDDILEMPTLDAESPVKYKDIAWNVSAEEIKSMLESIELKHIKKIAKEAGYTERSTSKKKAIENLVEIIISRRTRGDVFKTR